MMDTSSATSKKLTIYTLVAADTPARKAREWFTSEITIIFAVLVTFALVVVILFTWRWKRRNARSGNYSIFHILTSVSQSTSRIRGHQSNNLHSNQHAVGPLIFLPSHQQSISIPDPSVRPPTARGDVSNHSSDTPLYSPRSTFDISHVCLPDRDITKVSASMVSTSDVRASEKDKMVPVRVRHALRVVNTTSSKHLRENPGHSNLSSAMTSGACYDISSASDCECSANSLQSAARKLANSGSLPFVVEAAKLLSILLPLIVRGAGDASSVEWKLERCQCVIIMLKRATNVFEKASNGNTAVENPLLEDVYDAVNHLVELMKTYESKNRLVEVMTCSLFQRRQKEAETLIDNAIKRLQMGLRGQVSPKTYSIVQRVDETRQNIGKEFDLQQRPLETYSNNGPWSSLNGRNRYISYLDNDWPSVGGLPVVTTIGTQLRHMLNSGLMRWRVMGEISTIVERRTNEWISRVITKFSLDKENERADARQEGQTRLLSPESAPENRLKARRLRKEYQLDQIEIPEDHVMITDELLGKGGFGAVYLADYNGWNAAAKVIEIEHSLGGHWDEDEVLDVAEHPTPLVQRREEQRNMFLQELKIMMRLRSPQIVSVYGAITTRRDRLVLVMELLTGGNLRTLLSNDMEKLPEDQAWLILKDVCAGLVYLHSKTIVHGDLKSANVLFDGAGRAKIGDFGTTRWINHTNTTGVSSITKTRPATHISFAWAAPEVLNAETPCCASDMYSFAIVAWEVISRDIPWAKQACRPREIMTRVFKGERLPISQTFPVDLADIVQACWVDEPASRPTSADIMTSFKSH